MAPVNGAADAVTKMIARVFPVGLDSRFADQLFGDFPLWSPRKRAIECLEHEAEAPTARFRPKQRIWQPPELDKTVETFKTPKAMSQMLRGPDCVGMEVDGK